MELQARRDSEDSEVAYLRRELQRRDDFLAVAAHELRNPMHSLSLQLASAQALAGLGDLPAVLHRLRRAQATLNRYVDRATVLLDLGRLNAQAFPLARREVDLVDVLATVADSLRGEADFHGVRLDFEAPEVCRMYIDPLPVEQIVGNLISNAFKHAGGTRVTLALACNESRVTIKVVDDGRGISAVDQQEIFSKFERGAASPTAAGFGLGLWIVRELAMALGGRLTVDSKIGRGSSFELELFPESITERSTE